MVNQGLMASLLFCGVFYKCRFESSVNDHHVNNVTSSDEDEIDRIKNYKYGNS